MSATPSPRSGWLRICLMLAALVTASAHLPSAVQAESAQELLDRGLTALKEGRYRDATTHLDASYRLEKTPVALYNLGLAYNGLGYPAKAVKAFEAFVSFADPNKDAKAIASVEQEIERIKTSHTRFALALTPENTRIEIDGKPATPEDGELWVDPGQHRITITAPDYEPFEQIIQTEAGRFELAVNLRKPSGPPDARATELLNEGDGLMQAGDVGNAAARYGVAQRVWASPRGAGSLGLAQEAMGLLPEAEANLAKALRSPRDKWVRRNKRRLESARSRVDGALATLKITGPGHVGAEVFIDRRSVGTLPLPGNGEVRVRAGKRILTAKQERFDDYYQEIDLPARALKPVVISMQRKKVVVAAAVPTAAPEAAAPAAVAVAPAAVTTAPAAAPAPPPEEPLEEDTPLAETSVTTSDIEAMSSSRDAGRPPEEYQAVSGLEMGFGAGFQFWLDSPEGDADVAIAARLFSIGYRPVWPISFGIRLLDAHYDLSSDARAAFGAAPAIYVRGHSQRDHKAMTFDFWYGVAFQPIAFSVATYEADDTPTNLAALAEADVADVLANQAGLGDTISIQSVNIPLEIGFAFYPTENLAVEATAALSFWIQTQACYWDANDRVCYDNNLETLKSLYLGAGLSFLP